MPFPPCYPGHLALDASYMSQLEGHNGLTDHGRKNVALRTDRGVGGPGVMSQRVPARAPLDSVDAEIIEVVRLVGGSDPGRRLRWLLAFLDRDVSDAAAAVLAHRELVVF